MVQSFPTLVRTSHSHVGSAPWGSREIVFASVIASLPTRTIGESGGMLSSQGDAGTSVLFAYGPDMSFCGRLSPFPIRVRMLK